MAYDRSNIFAKILRGEIPCKKVHEDDHVLAFHDIAPVAPTHVLVIPKGEYTDAHDFAARASATEIAAYYKAVADIAKQLGVNDYRLVSNKGMQSGQTVFHFHTHIISGKNLGGLVGTVD